MTEFILVMYTGAGIISLIAILCIGYHCWERQSTPDNCPYCERKLDRPDRCDKCGAVRMNLGGING